MQPNIRAFERQHMRSSSKSYYREYINKHFCCRHLVFARVAVDPRASNCRMLKPRRRTWPWSGSTTRSVGTADGGVSSGDTIDASGPVVAGGTLPSTAATRPSDRCRATSPPRVPSRWVSDRPRLRSRPVGHEPLELLGLPRPPGAGRVHLRRASRDRLLPRPGVHRTGATRLRLRVRAGNRALAPLTARAPSPGRDVRILRHPAG